MSVDNFKGRRGSRTGPIKYKYSRLDVCKLAKVSPKKLQRDIAAKKLIIEDLGSVMRYVLGHELLRQAQVRMRIPEVDSKPKVVPVDVADPNAIVLPGM